jgi:hypothetical protein
MDSFVQRVAAQRILALLEPCDHHSKMTDSRYFFELFPGANVVGLVGLTINTGRDEAKFFGGRAHWMLSISLNKLPLAQWPPEFHALAETIVQRTLEGAGVPSTDLRDSTKRIAIVRRLCSDEERRKVTEPWLMH